MKKTLNEEVSRIKQVMGIQEQQEMTLQEYMDQLLENPVEFLNKLNTDEQFKNGYIQSYKSNPDNFDVLENVKLKHILKYRPVNGIIKDNKSNQIVKEIQIANLEEYNQMLQYVESEKAKGVDLVIITHPGKLYNTQGGDEMAQSFNIALGQQYFK